MPADAREPLASRVFEHAYGWLATPRDSLPACAARAGLGASLVAAYVQYLPDASAFFGPDGIGGHDSIARHGHYSGILFEWYTRLRVLHLASSSTLMWALYATLLVSAAMFALGYYARFAGVVLAVVQMIFYTHNPVMDGGWRALISPWIFYLALTDCEGQLSLTAWLRQRRGEPERSRAAPWGLRLLQVHLCAMYMVPGFERLDAEGWVRGEMVLRALLNVEYGRFELAWQSASGALALLTWAVLVLEPAAPFVLWLRWVGKWCALALIAMHACLEILTDTGWWQFMMVSALLTFLPPRWIRKVLWKPQS